MGHTELLTGCSLEKSERGHERRGEGKTFKSENGWFEGDLNLKLGSEKTLRERIMFK